MTTLKISLSKNFVSAEIRTRDSARFRENREHYLCAIPCPPLYHKYTFYQSNTLKNSRFIHWFQIYSLNASLMMIILFFFAPQLSQRPKWIMSSGRTGLFTIPQKSKYTIKNCPANVWHKDENITKDRPSCLRLSSLRCKHFQVSSLIFLITVLQIDVFILFKKTIKIAHWVSPDISWKMS